MMPIPAEVDLKTKALAPPQRRKWFEMHPAEGLSAERLHRRNLRKVNNIAAKWHVLSSDAHLVRATQGVCDVAQAPIHASKIFFEKERPLKLEDFT